MSTEKKKRKEFKHKNLLVLVALAADVIFVVFADLTSFILRFNGTFPNENFSAYIQISINIVLLRIGAFYVFHLYDRPKFKSNFETFINTLKASTASTIIILSFLYFLNVEAYPRSIATLSWIMTIIYISSWRYVAREFLNLYLGENFSRSQLLIIGIGVNAHETGIHLLRDAGINYDLLGYINPDTSEPRAVPKSHIKGNLSELESLISENFINEVVLADSKLSKKSMTQLINLLNQYNIVIKSLPSTYDSIIEEMVLSKSTSDFVGTTKPQGPPQWYPKLKRGADICISLVLIIITLPLFLLSLLLIKLTSPGPIFYSQKRTGLHGQGFVMYKLRSMRTSDDSFKNPQWAKKGDSRITSFGKIMRRYRIDELPQLLNVLKNDMSIIGPRPERPVFTNKFVKQIPFFSQRLKVKPGISGWAQVSMKYADSVSESREKLLYDIYYVQNMCFTLDLLIALKTFKVLLTGKGAQ